jgi:integrase
LFFTGSQLWKEAQLTVEQGFAKGTLQNLKIQISKYRKFCADWGCQEFPASLRTILMYMEWLGRQFSAASTIRNYLYGVKFWHIINGLSGEQFDGYVVKRMHKGLEKKLKHKKKQALPITPEVLLDIKKVLDLELPWDCTKWALYLTAFFLVCRKSNLVPLSVRQFDSSKQLTRAHFQQTGEDLSVVLTWTKTIQFNERKLVVPILTIKGSQLCPVEAFRRMCQLVKVPDNGPAFARIDKVGKVVPITYNVFLKELRKDISRTGRDPKGFSTHSFRRGAASFAYEAGVDAETVRIMGDWRSDCFREYLQISLHKKEFAARKMAQQIRRIESNKV